MNEVVDGAVVNDVGALVGRECTVSAIKSHVSMAEDDHMDFGPILKVEYGINAFLGLCRMERKYMYV